MSIFGTWLASKTGRSSETFFKAYYRYGAYATAPFSIPLAILIFWSDSTDPTPCYALAILYVITQVFVFYLAWRRCSR